MPRLKHSELESLSKALLELYAPGEYADLPSRVLRILHKCFSFEFGAYHELSGYENERKRVTNHRVDSGPEGAVTCELLKPGA
jgi:hypothetical protein